MNTSPKLFQSSLRMRKNIFAVHPGKNSCSCWYMNFLEFLRWDTNIVKLVLVNSFFRIILTKLLSSFDQIKLWSKKTRQEYWQTLPGRDESNKPNFWLRAEGKTGGARLQCAAHHRHNQDSSHQEAEPTGRGFPWQQEEILRAGLQQCRGGGSARPPGQQHQDWAVLVSTPTWGAGRH